MPSFDMKITAIVLIAAFAAIQSFRLDSYKKENELLQIEKQECNRAVKLQNSVVNSLKADINATNKELLEATPKIIEKYHYIKDDTCEKKLNSLLEAFEKDYK